jgi:ferritin-like metal-binding protein YciE
MERPPSQQVPGAPRRATGAIFGAAPMDHARTLGPEGRHRDGRNLGALVAFSGDQPASEDPMAEKKLNDLFLDMLKDIYFAERQIVKNLPKMAKAAQSEELKDAFLKHREETEVQIERLQQIFEMLGKRAQGKTCEAINGILEESEDIIADYKGSDALDAGLLADGQAVEHYEMARYGALKNWATQLGMNDAANLLDETLQEEKKTDALLTELAGARVNREAA